MIKKENILAFSRTMIDLGEATNLTADEAATSFAQFANVVGMPQENFDRLGSSVVALGNSMATTEADIVNMAMRLSGTGAQVGLAEAEIMALAASMSSVGINAEAGGSAMSTVMKKIQNAVADGGKDLAGFAEASGMTSQQFAEAWKNDPITAIDSFIKGLAESGAEGENLNEILGDLGIKGIQETDTLLRLAGASDLLGEAVKTSTGAWDENRALAEEAAQRYETFESKLGMLKNTVTDVAISIGNVLLPAVSDFVDFLRGMVDRFSQLDEKTMTIIAVIATLAAGFLLLIGPILMLVGFIPSMLAGFTALSTVFAAVTGPIGLAVAAVIGIGAALVIAYTQFEWFREIVGTVWEGIKSVIMSAVDGIVAFVQDIAVQIATFWNENGEQIKAATQNVWNAIKAVIEVVMPIIMGVISAVWFAIQVVVTTIWNNIKGVIQGALNVILGLVKAFAGLFTGDWSTMWDGVKQMFSGAVEFLWNAVQLMLWGRLLKGLAVFAGGFRTAITSMWTTIRSVFTNAINAIRNFFTSGFNAMRNIANTTMGSIRTVISNVWNTIKSVFTNVINSIKTTVSTGFNNVVTAVRTKMSDVVNAVKTKMSDMLKQVTNAAKDFVQAGKDLITGLIKGIKDMTAAAVGAITGVVDSVVNKAKSLLGIKSPSRVFMEIGGYISEGLAIGIDSQQKRVSQSITDIGNLMKDIMEHYSSETVKISKKSNEEIAKIEKRSAQDIAAIQKNAKSKKRALTHQEEIRIQRIKEDSAKKIADIEKKAMKDSIKLIEEADKEKLKEIKLFLDDKRSLEQLSLIEEAAIWEEAVKRFSDGTREKVEAQKEYRKSIEAVNKEIESINKDHLDRINKINDDLAQSEQKLTDEYNKAYESRVDSILNFAGIFDEFVSKFEGDGQSLLSNLQSQVTGLEEWREVLASLWTKIDDQALMEQLEAMGPKAVGELKALNSLSEEELAQYVALYNQKFALARDQAGLELEGMKEDTEDKINALREAANAELDKVHTDWEAKIIELTGTTEKELKSLKVIGRQAGEGLLQGLDSMKPALIAKATDIANAIKAALAAALDIHSPSRWMRDMIGKNMMLGWIEGMEAMRSAVIAVAKESTEWMTPSVPDLAGVRVPAFHNNNKVRDLHASDSSVRRGGDVIQNINITSPQPLSPSEIARKNKQAVRELGLQL